MKKYNTRPIDFTGCHPVIAEALKRGEEIECRVWGTGCAEKPRGCHDAWIARFWQSADYPYRTATDSFFRYAEPIPIKKHRIMPPERAIPVLIAGGWRFDDSGNMIGPVYSVVTNMFKLMGKPLSDPKVSAWKWPDCIIEEVEDDE